jgi:ribonuclease P protein component
VPRRVGTAVSRNRVRRRLRELFRRSRDLFAGRAVRMVVHARPTATTASFGELSNDYRVTVTRGLSRLR